MFDHRLIDFSYAVEALDDEPGFSIDVRSTPPRIRRLIEEAATAERAAKVLETLKRIGDLYEFHFSKGE